MLKLEFRKAGAAEVSLLSQSFSSVEQGESNYYEVSIFSAQLSEVLRERRAMVGGTF